jgi:exodeoxyribonuclease VII small subunit
MPKKYEELVEELTHIVRKIEEGDIPLDESIELYERGASLIRQCEAMLEEAEMKVSQLGQE